MDLNPTRHDKKISNHENMGERLAGEPESCPQALAAAVRVTAMKMWSKRIGEATIRGISKRHSEPLQWQLR